MQVIVPHPETLRTSMDFHGAVANLATLQALPAGRLKAGRLYWLMGRADAGDGAGGPFVWDATDRSTATGTGQVQEDEVTTNQGDGGLFIAHNSDLTGAAGCFKRVDWDKVHLKWYCVGDSVVADAAGTITAGTDCTNAINAWQKSSISKGIPAHIDRGIYYATGQITPDAVAPTANPSGRGGGVTITGDGMYDAVFYVPSLAGHFIDFTVNSASSDAFYFSGFSIKTLGTGGGGIKLGEGGIVVVDRYFMDGCGAGYWGLDLDNAGNGPYQVHIANSRFWNDVSEYKGGAVRHLDGHTHLSQNNFVSKQKKDGNVYEIGNVKNVVIPTITLESDEDGAAFASQSMLAFTGSPVSVWIGTIHGEGEWTNLIDFQSAASGRQMVIETVYAWQKNGNLNGNPDAKILKRGAANSYKVVLEKVFWKSDIPDTQAPAANSYLVDDSTDTVEIREYDTTTTGTLQDRPLKENIYHDKYEAPAPVSLGTTTAPGTTFALGRAGKYLVTATIQSTDGNHARSETFIATFDDQSSNDFTDIHEMDSITKGSGVGVTSFTKSVDNAGTVTISNTAWTSRSYQIHYSWQRIGRLTW